jgi:hypothetical protein
MWELRNGVHVTEVKGTYAREGSSKYFIWLAKPGYLRRPDPMQTIMEIYDPNFQRNQPHAPLGVAPLVAAACASS